MNNARAKRGALTLCALIALSAVRGTAVPAGQDSAAVELPILMYHHILKDKTKLGKYTISPEELEADLDWLLREGYEPITVQQLIDWTDGAGELPARPVMLTFDDGYESFYEYAFPLLRAKGCKAVYSVIGRYADEYTEQEDHHINYSHCTWEQIAELQGSGLVEIQNHSYDLHTNEKGRKGSMKVSGEAVSAYQERLQDDIGRMQELCQSRCGVTPTAFTYPFGGVSEEALPVLRKMGFRAALTCREQINLLTGDKEELFSLGRFNRATGQSAASLLKREIPVS